MVVGLQYMNTVISFLDYYVTFDFKLHFMTIDTILKYHERYRTALKGLTQWP